MIVACIFIFTLAGYIFSMSPGIVVGDSGEFCAAVSGLALPHSPGYPLFCLLGKAITIVFPLASVAYRINLFSALCAAACVTALYCVFRKLDDHKGSKFSACAAALAVGASSAFMSSAVQAEVFSLNSLFAILTVWAVVEGNVVIAGFIFGLGLGNHHTLIFVLPFVCGELIRTKRFLLREILACIGAAAIGFSIYAYLLLRAHAHPPLNWGDPENIHNLWRVISRADYGSLSLTVGEKMPMNSAIILRQLQRYFVVFIQQFTVAGVLLGVVGWTWALMQRLARAKELLITWLLIGPFFLLCANLPFNGEAGGILERFYILPNMFFAFGIFYALEFFRMSRGRINAIGVISLCAVTLLLAHQVMAAPFRWNLACHDYGRNILRSLPYGSILFIDGGDDTFYSLAYLTFAQKLRPDIELHDRGGLVFKNIYGSDFRALSRSEKEARRQIVEKSFLGLRPLYFSTFNPLIMPAVPLSLQGILYAPSSQKYADPWPCYNMRGVFGGYYPDYRTRALIPIYPFFVARHKPELAEAALSVVMDHWADVLWVSSNAPVLLNETAYNEINSGNVPRGKEILKKAVSLFPDDAYALSSLGVLCEKQNNFIDAERYNKLAIAADPHYSDAYYNLMVLYWKAADWKSATQALNDLQTASPNDPRVEKYMPFIRSKLNGARRSQ